MSTRPGEQRTNWVNVLRFVLSRPSRFPVLPAHKVPRSGFGAKTIAVPPTVTAWLAEHSTTAEQLVKAATRPARWEKSREFDQAFPGNMPSTS